MSNIRGGKVYEWVEHTSMHYTECNYCARIATVYIPSLIKCLKQHSNLQAN